MYDESILPDNATSLEKLLERAMSPEIDLATLSDLLSPDRCPIDLLGWLAWALSVDEWDDSWPESQKRQVCRDSLWVHQHKGTIGAVKRALAAAGYQGAQVVERYNWKTYDGSSNHDGSINHEPPDHWAEYRVILTRPITIEQAAQVRRILENVAPARCELVALDFTQAQNLYDAQINHDGQFTHGVT